MNYNNKLRKLTKISPYFRILISTKHVAGESP